MNVPANFYKFGFGISPSYRMKKSMVALLSGIIDYLGIPIAVIWIAAHAMLWWTSFFTTNRENRLISGVFFLLLLIAFVYENGYKKYYRFGNKKYFYVVHIAPLCVAICGFTYGFWATSL